MIGGDNLDLEKRTVRGVNLNYGHLPWTGITPTTHIAKVRSPLLVRPGRWVQPVLSVPPTFACALDSFVAPTCETGNRRLLGLRASHDDPSISQRGIGYRRM